MKNSKLALAELCGIMLGDGSFIKAKRCYSISISFNRNELDYLDYVLKMLNNLFPNEKISVYDIKSEFLIRTYSSKISNALLEAGLETGNKTKRDIWIPRWITSKRQYSIAFLRGMFDTDGCIYRKYGSYLQLQLKLANKTLVHDIQTNIANLGFNPTNVILDLEKVHKSYEWKFYLSRQAEIHKFIKDIGFCNSKHLSRYKKLQLPL